MVDMHVFWPDDALLVVAEKVLEDSVEVGDKATAARAAMAVHVAAAVATAAPPVCTCACCARSACERWSTAYGLAALCAAATAASLRCATRRVP